MPVDLLFSDPTLAKLYDAVCPRQQRADFDFYLPLIMASERVLDIGRGTGALLREAREAGHCGRLCGLDPAPGMIAVARQYQGIDWVDGDLASAGFDAEFDLAVMTGHAFQVLLEDDEIRAALNAIHAALRPGGTFAFETRNPLAREWHSWSDSYATEVHDHQGNIVRVGCRVEAPFDGRVVTFTQTYTSAKWAKPKVSWSTLRFLTAEALASFLMRLASSLKLSMETGTARPWPTTIPKL